MASSSAEQPPVEMDAKLMMATGISNCQRLLEDLLNKGDAKTVVVMVSSNQLPNAAKPPPGPATMDPQLLSLACSGSCQELSLLLNRNAAPGRSDVMPTRSSLELGTNASSVTHQVSNEVEEGFSPALLLEGITVEGNTALHAVATNGDSDDFLMSANVIYDKANHLMFAQNKNGDTPLHCAARAGKSKMVRRLIALARTEDEGGERLKELLRKENMRKETALHEAVRINDQHTVELLMVEDSELACFPRDGCSPLYQAILLDDDNIAHYLLAKSDGNLSYSGPNGQNALHAAVLRGTSALTKKLLEWKEDLAAQRDENGSTPLHFAAALQNQHWCRSVCQQVLEANLDALYQSDHDGLFPIHIAASVGNKWAVALFLQKSPGCGGLRDAKERTFLHVAVEKYKVSTVSFACRNRSLTWILNVQDNDGNTALHLAVHSGRLLVFCPLLGNRTLKEGYTVHSNLAVLETVVVARITFKRSILTKQTVMTQKNLRRCKIRHKLFVLPQF